MTFSEFYAGHGWIKVKRAPARDEARSWEEEYRLLESHHRCETEFLIAEIRRLAAKADELGRVAMNRRDPDREDAALDALIVLAHLPPGEASLIEAGLFPPDCDAVASGEDVLTDEDRAALDAMGTPDEVVRRAIRAVEERMAWREENPL